MTMLTGTKKRRKTLLRPPLVEVVLGFQFDRLKGFTTAHLGAFWRTLGQLWPTVEDAAPLAPQFERFGPEMTWSHLREATFRITDDQSSRLQIRNADGTRMIQLQNSRFHYNWLATAECAADYSRYDLIKREFGEQLQRLRTFLQQESLGALKPNQWEVTYVNHIPKGTVWDGPDDWHRVFDGLAIPTSFNTGTLEDLSVSLRYEIPPQLGRVHVDLHHGRRGKRDGPEILVFNLTARGPARDGVENDLDIGHEAILDAFWKLTSDTAREYWQEIV